MENRVIIFPNKMQLKIFFILACFLTFLHSCTSQPNKFVNHEKWMIESTINRSRVRSNPNSVVESSYYNLNDTIFSDTLKGKLSGTWVYHFDREGNTTSVNFKMNDSVSLDFFYRMDEDGRHHEFVSNVTNDTSRDYLRSKKISENQYKRETYRKGKKRYSEIWTFEKSGEVVKKERYFNDTLGFTVMEFYEDGLLKRSTKTDNYWPTEDIYYYSKNKYLDSIVVFMRNMRQMKLIYFNNDYGDPIYHEESVSDNVKKRQWMRYRYDENGNWIEMIQRTEDENDFNGFSEGQKYPHFRWVKRQFKY